MDLLQGKSSKSGASILGLTASLTTAVLVIRVILYTWVGIGQVAVELEGFLRANPEKDGRPDLYGISLVQYMLEMRTYMLSMGIAVFLALCALALLFFFHRRFQRKVGAVLSYLQTAEGAAALRSYGREP